jgi:hypothetical protein
LVTEKSGAVVDNEGSGVPWAEVGERLDMTPQEISSLQAVFGDLLGLQDSKTVPEGMAQVIAFISRERRNKIPDDEIIERISCMKSSLDWPEQILARMETASTFALPPTSAPAQSAIPSGLQSVHCDQDPLDELVSKDESWEVSVKETILDLRREIRSHFAKQRADILRLDQCLRKLTLEVRDLRYALVLGFSRRDRKRGKKGISNLLLW